MIITTKEATIYPLILLGILYLNTVSCDESDVSRNKKHFSLFSVVTFKNDACTSESTYNGGAVTGTCYSATECNDKDGTKSGNCASGFGVCCIFMYSLLSDKTITENRTYFQNPLFPNIETTGGGGSFTYTIGKMQTDICQLRLDFDTFVITGPTATGENIPTSSGAYDTNCGDKLTVTLGSGAFIPVLCGVMTGAHLYMDIGSGSTDTAALAMALVATTKTTYANAYRKWRVKTSQIPCWAPYRAPEGCNQYFMDYVGQIVSPNFSKDPAGTSRGADQLNSGTDLANNNLKYCIRRAKNTCCILYQVCNQYKGTDLTAAEGAGAALTGDEGWISEGWSFHTTILKAGALEGSGAAVGALATAENDLGLVDAQCSADYVEIPDSTVGKKNYGSAMRVNTRYCGHRMGYIPAITATKGDHFHLPVWDCTEPFEVTYRTDHANDIGVQATAQNGDNGRGLCLDFTQDQC